MYWYASKHVCMLAWEHTATVLMDTAENTWCVCMSVCMHGFVFLYAYMHVCMHVCIYVCRHVCMHV